MEFTREQKLEMCKEAFNKAKMDRYIKRIKSQCSRVMFSEWCISKYVGTLYGVNADDFINTVESKIGLDKGCRSTATYIGRIYKFADMRLRFTDKFEMYNDTVLYDTLYDIQYQLANNSTLDAGERKVLLRDVSWCCDVSKQDRFFDLYNNILNEVVGRV